MTFLWKSSKMKHTREHIWALNSSLEKNEVHEIADKDQRRWKMPPKCFTIRIVKTKAGAYCSQACFIEFDIVVDKKKDMNLKVEFVV